MKKRIVTAVIIACLSLCAAVWPQPDTREERPAPIPTHAAAAPKTDAVTTAERENTETPRAEPDEELGAVPVPAPAEPMPAVETPQPEPAPPTPQPEPAPPTPQPTIELQPGDKVYVTGFGWVEYEGPNRCEDGTDIYENGNKIGVMG